MTTQRVRFNNVSPSPSESPVGAAAPPHARHTGRARSPPPAPHTDRRGGSAERRSHLTAADVDVVLRVVATATSAVGRSKWRDPGRAVLPPRIAAMLDKAFVSVAWVWQLLSAEVCG